jgi:hypothetical protein
LGTQFPTPRDASNHLLAAIDTILGDGYKIKGIKPEEVIIEHEPPGNDMAPLDEPTGPVPDQSLAIALGMGKGQGDLSNCCGALTEMKGTCKYCMNCGSSDGCS